MITDQALLRQYLKPGVAPCPITEILGVSTYRVGIGEGVFYCLTDGRVIDQEGEIVDSHKFKVVG